MRIYPSIFFRLSGARSWGQQSQEKTPDFPLPRHFLQPGFSQCGGAAAHTLSSSQVTELLVLIPRDCLPPCEGNTFSHLYPRFSTISCKVHLYRVLTPESVQKRTNQISSWIAPGDSPYEAKTERAVLVAQDGQPDRSFHVQLSYLPTNW